MCKEQKYQLTNDELKKYGDAIRKLVDSYVTPISFFKNNDETAGFHLGTGYFFENDNGKFLITNHHVAFPKIPGVNPSEISLAFHFKGDGQYVRIHSLFASEDYPTDVAVVAVFDNVWNAYHDESCCLTSDRFEDKFEHVENELFFIEGFPGERAKMLSDTLLTHPTPLLTSRTPLIDGFCPDTHFALYYDVDNYVCTGEQKYLPSPDGMSGSLIWNTKIEECKQKGIEWNSNMPKVVGIVHRYCPEEKCLIATKVEHMKMDSLAMQAVIKKNTILKKV